MKNLILVVFALVVIGVLFFYPFNENSFGQIAINNEAETDLKEFIFDADIVVDELFSKDLEFEEIGTYNEETVLELTNPSYNDIKENLKNIMSEDAIRNELSFRDYTNSKGSLYFINNESFNFKKELAEADIIDIKLLNLFEAEEFFPGQARITKQWAMEENYMHFRYCKVASYVILIENGQKSMKKVETIYIIGNKDDNYKILDSMYYVNGEQVNFANKIKPRKIEFFEISN